MNKKRDFQNFFYLIPIKKSEKSMKYKGFSATAEYDENSKVYSGEVTNTRAVITFHGSSIEEAEKEFHTSVDDYLEWCENDA